MTLSELILETAIKEADDICDVRLDKAFAEGLLEMLKEREPKRMWLRNGELCCPQCGAICKSYYHYCNECGQAVKWDGNI